MSPCMFLQVSCSPNPSPSMAFLRTLVPSFGCPWHSAFSIHREPEPQQWQVPAQSLMEVPRSVCGAADRLWDFRVEKQKDLSSQLSPSRPWWPTRHLKDPNTLSAGFGHSQMTGCILTEMEAFGDIPQYLKFPLMRRTNGLK